MVKTGTREMSFAKLLGRWAAADGSRVAMRKKDLGIWQVYTWQECYENVKHFCLGLIKLGLNPEDKVLLIGENNPECYWAEIAVTAAHAVIVPIYSDSSASELQYYMSNSESSFVIAEDQEQVDKFLSNKDNLPLLKKVVYWDPKGLWFYENPELISLEDVMQLGKAYEKEKPGLFEELVDNVNSDDLAVILYTSGATGLPKAAMHCVASLLGATRDLTSVNPIEETDKYLSYISLAWIAEQYFGIASWLLTGMVVFFPEEPETVQQNIREVGPKFLFLGTRLWESYASSVHFRILETDRLRRAFYNFFIGVGYRVINARLEKRSINPLWQILYQLGELMVYRQIKDKLGILHVKHAICSGTLISPATARYYSVLGVDLKNLYGSTEGAIGSVHTDKGIKIGTVGHILPNVEVKVTPEGELLIRSKFRFMGYYKNPEATRAQMTDDGFVHTGDAGYVDKDDHIVMLDRLAEMEELADGIKFPPQFIESTLRFSPYIQEAIVIGGKEREYVTAIIGINFSSVSKWAEKHHVPYATLVDLSQREEVGNLIADEIRKKVNPMLPEGSRLRKFTLLHKEFDPDDAELTRTRKLRRKVIAERYAELVAAMHGAKGYVTVAAEVTFRDGRKGMTKADVYVRNV